MKTARNIFLAIVMAFALGSCQQADSEKDLGFTKIYIPQATITGLDNTYPIPNGSLTQNSKYVCKYNEASGTLDINVGVVRSGYVKESKAFSVKLGVCASETQRKLAEYDEKGIPASELPLSVCSIPQTISVEQGKNSNSCYVSVNMKALSKDRASIFVGDTYKILVLGLEISDPTEYELADLNTNVVICIDLNSEEWDKADSPVRVLFPFI